MLGPLTFAMYISLMSNVVAADGLCYRQYADDTQLYMAVRPRSATDLFRTLSLYVDDVFPWFLQNRLLLNPSKTEAVLFGIRQTTATMLPPYGGAAGIIKASRPTESCIEKRAIQYILHSTYQQVAGSIPGRSTAGQQPWTSSYTAR